MSTYTSHQSFATGRESWADGFLVGPHKHMIVIKIQGLIHKRTGHLIPTAELWAMLGDLYDLEALEEMVRLCSLLPALTPIRMSTSDSQY